MSLTSFIVGYLIIGAVCLGAVLYTFSQEGDDWDHIDTVMAILFIIAWPLMMFFTYRYVKKNGWPK